MIRGKKVPVICKNIKTTAIRVVFLFRKHNPIAISQYPIIIVHVSGLRNGIQNTVSIISSVAGDKSKTLRIPNQKNIIKRGILTK
jgi:hypothetical protein